MAQRKKLDTGSNDSSTRNRAHHPGGNSFRLNEHKAVIIVGLISLCGVVTAAVITGSGSVIAAVINSWDKQTSEQNVEESVREVEDILAYNERRKELLESGLNNTLHQLEEAEGKTTGRERVVVRRMAASVKEKKGVVKLQYRQMIDAIKNKKRLQAEEIKTTLNTTILDLQKEIERDMSSTPELRKYVLPVWHILRNEDELDYPLLSPTRRLIDPPKPKQARV